MPGGSKRQLRREELVPQLFVVRPQTLDVERLYEEAKAELAETKEKLAEVAETARELEDKLEAFEATEPDEQQKMILKLQEQVRKLEKRLEHEQMGKRDLQNKCNDLIRQVKLERKKRG